MCTLIIHRVKLTTSLLTTLTQDIHTQLIQLGEGSSKKRRRQVFLVPRDVYNTGHEIKREFNLIKYKITSLIIVCAKRKVWRI